MNIPFYSSNRRSLYGVSGVPHVQIDGVYPVVGASSCSGAASQYRSYINLRLNACNSESPILIEGAYSQTDPPPVSAANLSMTVTFTVTDPATLNNPAAYLLVVEDGIAYGGTTYNKIARAAHFEYVSLANQGDFVTITHDFPGSIEYQNRANLKCVAWLQSMSGNHEIYQAASIPMVADFQFAFEPAVGSVPNGNGTCEFSGTLVNISEASDDLTVSLNNTFGWDAEFKLEGEQTWHIDPSMVSLGASEETTIYMRVHTDGDVRIGTGGIDVYSAVSERTQVTLARVFNGSPAVLFVDDDGVRTDELPIINALDAAGYLYDHYDVFNDHAGNRPTADGMEGFNVVLYHMGWNSSDIPDADDLAAMQAFMDSGGGLIMSSQALFNNVTSGPFTQDYLGVDSWTLDVGADQANGIGSDPISDGMAYTLEYPMYYLNKADALVLNGIATPVFNNESVDIIGCRADNGTCRTVTFAWALNGFDEGGAYPNNHETIVDRSIIWIMEGQSQSVEDDVLAAVPSAIRGIEPNPFAVNQGHATTIRMRLSDRAASGPIQLDVMDLNGRLVDNLQTGHVAGGISTASWDGRDLNGNPVGAGVYYATLSTVEGVFSARMVVVR